MMRRYRSFFITIAILAVLSVGVFPGGNAEGAESTDMEGKETVGAADDQFPITIEHKYGTVTIPNKPERVVSVGFTEHDVLLALGVIPVGLRDWYGNQPFATWPWAQDELGDAQPTVIGAGELDIEAVVALNPDIIVGISSGMSADEYALLSQIAPTIAQSGEYLNFGTPWDVETLTLGKVLGYEEEAREIVDSLNGRMEQAKMDNPSFVGASGSVAFLFQNERGAYSSQDIRSRLLTQLGFQIPSEYDDIAGESFYLTFSDELISLLDTDVIVWLTTTPDGRDAIKGLPLRDTMRAYREGRELFMDPLVSAALSFASPLSLSYALDVMIPGLVAAVDGDPSTPLPENVR